MADYIISSWDEFLAVNSTSNTVKFSNPHEQDGEIILDGEGSFDNPFIVSTYDELLFATGATFTWQVKLVDKQKQLYKYNDIYCLYDSSPTTIDFNDISPDGYSSNFIVYPTFYGNGWTFKNIRLTTGYWSLYGYFCDAIFADVYDTNNSNTSFNCGAQVSNIKMSGVFSKGGKAIFGIRSGSNAAYRGLINSSFDFTITGDVVLFTDSGNGYQPKMRDVHVNINMSTNSTGTLKLSSHAWAYYCLFTGKINAPNGEATTINTYYLIDGNSQYCVIDLESDNENPPLVNLAGNSSSASTICLYSNDRGVNYYTNDFANRVGVSSDTMEDAQALFNLGFPIPPN